MLGYFQPSMGSKKGKPKRWVKINQKLVIFDQTMG